MGDFDSARMRTYAFVGALAIVAGIFTYTYSLVRSFEAQTETLTQVIANFCAIATFPAVEDETVREVFDRVIRDVRFPIIIADQRGVPYTWKNLSRGLDPDLVGWEEFREADPNNPSQGVLGEVIRTAKRLEKKGNMILMTDTKGTRYLGRVYYDRPAITSGLAWLPVAAALALGLFIVMAYLGIGSIIMEQRRSIWVGMARETAHQLGTPLSSLMGWLQHLKDSCADSETRQIVREMEHDVLRLSKISSRFSKVGSQPKLERQDVVEIVRSAVGYHRKRLPSLGRDIEIKEHFGNVPKAMVNPDLLSWAVENLVKNAIDALDKPRGIIEVRTTYIPGEHRISIEVEDNGKGIDRREAKKIFEPGYTTRRGGWGLGLPLARRVVEEYHGGKLKLLKSEVGKGSIFVIELAEATA